MPSRRVIKGLSQPVRVPKPATPLQEELQARCRLEAQQTAALVAAIKEMLAGDNEQNQRAGGGMMDEPQGMNHLDVPDDGDYPPDADDEEAFDIHQFMPLPHHVKPEVLDPVQAQLQRDQHLANRLAHKDKWSWQYAVMLPTFLRCKMETLNWGNEDNSKKDLRPPCTCASQTKRNVDLVDLTSKRCTSQPRHVIEVSSNAKMSILVARRQVKVQFCKNCDLSDPTRLLQMGYIASSPSKPRTAFSVRLLVHHHSQWVRYAVPTQAFCEGLDESLNSHNPVILTSSGKMPRPNF
ncbi:uncharacterized protein MELLADRAFT_69741 [Melampsora larici-populina 98AG31]|uniref:CxC1-like cysteine cluster associated with KDZ transposases domain-containing protein n=1 Tax=Melampsora larici-populina (strain 98AG31 / pathotype 3-4-7) TaxID=747676 RepID=F4SC01_MELLP|nr:uncharacterized protein MELLADRAFT_69741 [Melampsora larici-populina 98AG31]EGF97832.1 hypothetical protein MELLADRAFT_69741 [Melampsora larici-populina 98AG31]